MSYHYLLDLALILVSTKLLGLLTQRFQMPQVVGALLAGLILGPAGLNVLTETDFISQLSRTTAGWRLSFCGSMRRSLAGIPISWQPGAVPRARIRRF